MIAADADALLEVFGDPTVMASFGRGPFDASEMSAWVRRNLEHQAAHGYGLFTIVEKATSEVIGDCGLEWMEEDGGGSAVELGYDLRADRWGQGLAAEAARAVAAWAREHGIERVVSLIRVGNDGSARVARSVGMVLEGVARRNEVDYWVFGLPPSPE